MRFATHFLVLALALLSVDARADDRPNFLIILCDDLGYGDLACLGSKTIKTPHLDELAQEGALLTSCYSTAPVCSSSRAGLLTGRCPSRIGVYDWIPGGHPMHLRASEITIPQLLKKGGYETCHVGKWHCNGKFNSPDQPQPGDQGFDHWYSTQNNASPSHANPRNFVRNGKPVGQQEGYSCGLVVDEAIQWLTETRDDSKPFFQFVCFHEPHEPVASPQDLVDLYPSATKKGEALYYANVTNMDRAVGRLTKALDDLELTDNTFVLFTSDNGPETLNRYGGAWRSHGSPGPLRGMKLHLYEAGIRVPSILRFPGHTKPGQKIDRAICALDLLPTLCSLAKVEPPTDRKLDGANFLPALQGKKVERHTPLYWHYFRSVGEPKAAMRIGDWMILGKWDGPLLGPGGSVRPGDMKHIKESKLVEFELYNLKIDRAQQTDLVQDHPEEFAKFKAMLLEKYNEVQAEGPVWKLPSRRK